MTETVEEIPEITSEHGTTTRLIADSISVDEHRLTTFEVRIWRSMLSELNTHRVFSRNSASSRAIPLAKQMERVRTDTAGPIKWAAEQKGMSGGDEIERPENGRSIWESARDQALLHAGALGELGIHKSIANRLLEPFMFHTVVITASSYGNFFGLRCSPAAQPEINVAAEQMRTLFENHIPALITPGFWHLPYIGTGEVRQAEEWLDGNGGVSKSALTQTLVRMSSARCAAVSYMRHADWRDIEQDIGLYDKLTAATPMHASPLEHVATPDPSNSHIVTVNSFFDPTETRLLDLTLPRYGNFLGWHQHRFDVEIARDYQAFS